MFNKNTSLNKSPKIIVGPVISELVTMRECIQIAAEYIDNVQKGNCLSLPRVSKSIGKNSVVLTAGGVINNYPLKVCGFRIYNTFSPKDFDFHVTAIYSTKTGILEGIYVGDDLGEWRCGAIGGVAIDRMVSREVNTLGIIGCGRQARTQLKAAVTVRKFRFIIAYSRNNHNKEKFCKDMSLNTGCEIKAASSIDEVLDKSNVLISATNSKEVIFKSSLSPAIIHINHIGPKLLEKSELPRNIYDDLSLVATDSLAQYNDLAGNLDITRHQICSNVYSLGNLPRINSKGRTLFLSLGLAGVEVMIAKLVLDRA